jgi:hypothetical protein
MEQQISRINRGETDSLINPAPEFLHLVVADRDCATKVQEVHLSNDLWATYDTIADSRFAQLRSLPNLERVYLVKMFYGSNVFLKNIRGMKSVRSMGMYASGISSEGIQYIAEMPNLDMLSFGPVVGDRIDLDPLKNHPKLRRLQIEYHSDPPYRGPVPNEHLDVLKRLPNLRFLSLSFCEITDEAMETLKRLPSLEHLSVREASFEQIKELRQALPDTEIATPPRLLNRPHQTATSTP